MALVSGTMNAVGTNLASLITYAELHTGDPGAAGTSNTTTAARLAVSFTVASGGNLSLTSSLAFTGGAASGPCTYISLWGGGSATTTKGSGTFRGSYALTGDQTFNASGQYSVTALNINLTAS